MFSMRLDSLIRSLVETLMGEKDKEETFRSNHALIVSFNLELRYYSSSHKFDCKEDISFLFQCPYLAVGGTTHTFMKEGENWKFLSSHDSCWISAVRDEINKLYFKMAAQLIESIGDPNLAPINLDNDASLGFGCPLYTWIPVNIVKDETDPNGYRKRVQPIEFIKLDEATKIQMAKVLLLTGSREQKREAADYLAGKKA